MNRTRVILMNGIEAESIVFSHQFARHTDNPELLQALALGRRVGGRHLYRSAEARSLNPVP